MRNLNFRSLAKSNFHDHELLRRFNRSRKSALIQSKASKRSVRSLKIPATVATIFQLMTHVKSSFQSAFAAQTFCTTFPFILIHEFTLCVARKVHGLHASQSTVIITKDLSGKQKSSEAKGLIKSRFVADSVRAKNKRIFNGETCESVVVGVFKSLHLTFIRRVMNKNEGSARGQTNSSRSSRWSEFHKQALQSLCCGENN